MSRLRSFRKCKQREFFEYVEGFRPIDEDENLAFGSLWHAGMDAWWGEIAYARDEFALESALDAIRGKARDAFAQVRAEELLAGYDARWREETVRAFDVRSIEVEFRAGLLNPDTLRTSRTWILGGKVDKCIATRDGNVPGIVEHKTSSDDVSPGSPYWQKLEMDHQVSNYYVGAETFGFRPEFCLYDVVLKPGQKPLKATPPDKRKYKADGTLYANQRENDETPEEYRGRVREAIEAEPERFFVRAEIPRTDAMLKDFLADVWDEGLAMRQVHRRGRAPRNPDACHAYGTCPFWSACSTKTDPAEMPERYQRLAWPHPELTPDEGEPK
ncbi:MAG TPA: PD-(D/E)XK nuclease family protein [Planctomycetota bacterium]|nr:PD-(D/E)XK nuclease family protein [Planctomycetota bacterium]